MAMVVFCKGESFLLNPVFMQVELPVGEAVDGRYPSPEALEASRGEHGSDLLASSLFSLGVMILAVIFPSEAIGRLYVARSSQPSRRKKVDF